MAKIRPNQLCPCGSEVKYKKCCFLFLQQSRSLDHPEKLVRARYTAMVIGDVKFLWESFHPQSPVRLNETFAKFEEDQKLVKTLNYEELIILDGEIKRREARVVTYVRCYDGPQDLGYLEEAQLELFEQGWLYLDGLKRSSARLGCDPLSIKVGQLETIFPWESPLN